MSQSHALLSITVLNTAYVYKCFVRNFASKDNQCRRLCHFQSNFDSDSPFPPHYIYYHFDCNARLVRGNVTTQGTQTPKSALQRRDAGPPQCVAPTQLKIDAAAMYPLFKLYTVETKYTYFFSERLRWRKLERNDMCARHQ